VRALCGCVRNGEREVAKRVLAVMCRVRAQKHKIDKSRPQKSIR
jgi:hypothetical protein